MFRINATLSPFKKKGCKAIFLKPDTSPNGLKAALENLDMSEGMLRRKGGVKKPAESESESRGFLTFVKDCFPLNVDNFRKILIINGWFLCIDFSTMWIT